MTRLRLTWAVDYSTTAADFDDDAFDGEPTDQLIAAAEGEIARSEALSPYEYGDPTLVVTVVPDGCNCDRTCDACESDTE